MNFDLLRALMDDPFLDVDAHVAAHRERIRKENAARESMRRYRHRLTQNERKSRILRQILSGDEQQTASALRELRNGQPAAGRAYLVIVPTVAGNVGLLRRYSVVEAGPGVLPTKYVTALEPPLDADETGFQSEIKLLLQGVKT